jgi:hypothetical protein
LKEICSDVIPADQWYYDPNMMTLNVSWSPTEQQDLTGKLILCGPMNDGVKDMLGLDNTLIPGEAYHFEGEDVQISTLKLNGLPVEKVEDQEYHLSRISLTHSMKGRSFDLRYQGRKGFSSWCMILQEGKSWISKSMAVRVQRD